MFIIGFVFGGAICVFLFFATIILWKGDFDFVKKKYSGNPRIFITGDKHRDFKTVKRFCKKNQTTLSDCLIILGDSGINYYENKKDKKLKKKISKLNITLFCIQGNKERRANTISSYGVRSYCGGIVYCEPKYPNILFAVDGDIYTFEGKRFMVIGGAHSVDKQRCIAEGKPFFDDEMPSFEIKQRVEKNLLENREIFGFLTHTCPIKYIPTEMFISNRTGTQKKKRKRNKKYELDIDRSTEEWLGKIESSAVYKKWYCGHYHIDKQIEKITMLYHEFQRIE